MMRFVKNRFEDLPTVIFEKGEDTKVIIKGVEKTVKNGVEKIVFKLEKGDGDFQYPTPSGPQDVARYFYDTSDKKEQAMLKKMGYRVAEAVEEVKEVE